MPKCDGAVNKLIHSLYQFYSQEVLISDSIVASTSDCHGKGPGFDPQHGQGFLAYIFAITTH
jgi:hypothetical protein